MCMECREAPPQALAQPDLVDHTRNILIARTKPLLFAALRPRAGDAPSARPFRRRRLLRRRRAAVEDEVRLGRLGLDVRPLARAAGKAELVGASRAARRTASRRAPRVHRRPREIGGDDGRAQRRELDRLGVLLRRDVKHKARGRRVDLGVQALGQRVAPVRVQVGASRRRASCSSRGGGRIASYGRSTPYSPQRIRSDDCRPSRGAQRLGVHALVRRTLAQSRRVPAARRQRSAHSLERRANPRATSAT